MSKCIYSWMHPIVPTGKFMTLIFISERKSKMIAKNYKERVHIKVEKKIKKVVLKKY